MKLSVISKFLATGHEFEFHISPVFKLVYHTEKNELDVETVREIIKFAEVVEQECNKAFNLKGDTA